VIRWTKIDSTCFPLAEAAAPAVAGALAARIKYLPPDTVFLPLETALREEKIAFRCKMSMLSIQ
jgi:hypothetical protein